MDPGRLGKLVDVGGVEVLMVGDCSNEGEGEVLLDLRLGAFALGGEGKGRNRGGNDMISFRCTDS